MSIDVRIPHRLAALEGVTALDRLEGSMGVERVTVTVEEAGEMLGISRGLAYELVRRGELPHIRLGRRIVVPVRALMALVEGEDVAASA
jgi:excisionase family DNA binding protein